MYESIGAWTFALVGGASLSISVVKVEIEGSGGLLKALSVNADKFEASVPAVPRESTCGALENSAVWMDEAGTKPVSCPCPRHDSELTM